MWTESAKMVIVVQGGQDRRLKSPFLTKKDDLGIPSIQCSINGYNFQKTLCDTGSGVNIMAAATYQLLLGTTNYAIQRILRRLRKQRVPFGGLKDTERLAKSSTKLCCLFELHRIQGSKKTSRRRTSYSLSGCCRHSNTPPPPASYIRRNYVKIQLGGEHPHLSS